jgi:hypothetical protein
MQKTQTHYFFNYFLQLLAVAFIVMLGISCDQQQQTKDFSLIF